MPWNENSGGGGPRGPGGGNNNNNPWGNGPNRGRNGGGNQEPDLEELVQSLQNLLNGLFGGGGRKTKGGKRGGGGVGLSLILAIATIGWILWPGNFYYIVSADKAGAVLRFGEYVRTGLPGFHMKLPYPIETVLLPEVTTTQSVDVGVTQSESLMITRDENIVDIDFVVQYRVDLGYADGVRDYLFNIRQPQATVKAVAESAMREVVGKSGLESLITSGRDEVASSARVIIQNTLNEYQAGIQVLEVQLEESSAPASVVDAFRDVDAARQDKDRFQLEAQRDANRIVPEARGEAARILEQADGYRERVIAEATGQADRFNAIYAEYQLAPEVTRQRMYLETMEAVLGRSELIILDQDGGTVPYLPLDRIGQSRGPTTTASGSGQGGN